MQISGNGEQTAGILLAFHPSTRLVQAAHEFEGQMMKELLKPITEDAGLSGDETGAFMSTGGALSDFAGEALGQALSQQGGFGIADRIIAQLAQAGNTSDSAQNGGMRNPE